MPKHPSSDFRNTDAIHYLRTQKQEDDSRQALEHLRALAQSQVPNPNANLTPPSFWSQANDEDSSGDVENLPNHEENNDGSPRIAPLD